MKKRAKLIALLMAAALAAAPLAGCGSNTSDTAGSSVSSEIENAEAAEGFLYEVTEDNTVTILGLDPEAEDPGDAITIPDSIDGKQVTAIGEKAFWGNLNIQTVTLPDTLTTIEARAFDDCSNLTSINLPSGLDSIGDGAFFCCCRLEDTELPDTLTAIGKGAFYNCQALTEVTLPDSLTTMGNYVFYGCTGLSTVTINEGLNEIPMLTFKGCTGLTEVTLPSTVTTIGDHAFNGCEALTSVSMPVGMESIGEEAFQGCVALNDVAVTAKTVGAKAFYSCSAMTNLTLSSNVETLGDECFAYTGLESLKIPASVTEAGTEFASHTSIAAYETEEGGNYTTVDGVLFNKELTTLVAYPVAKEGESYTVPDGTTEIAPGAFGESSLTAITLPEGVKTIGDNAFRNVMMTEFQMPDTVETLGESAFASCISMTSVKLSDAVTELPKCLFDGCGSLTDITFPASLQKIGEEVFRGCDSLTTLTIPDTVTEVDPKMDMSSNITAFAVSDNSAAFSVKDGVLFSKDGKTLVNYPNGNIDLDAYAVPDGTETIGTEAFCGVTGMELVTLADSVTTLEELSLEDVNAVQADDALTDIGSDALGYTFNVEMQAPVVTNGFVLYGTSGSKAEEYADEQDMAFATGEMKLSAEELTMQAGETQTLSLENADQDHLYYFSSDENILTVDETGTITAVANGTTAVVAAIGTKYFVCHVTVEGGNDPTENTSLPGYTLLTKDTYQDWTNAFIEKNDGPALDEKANMNVFLYTGSEYIPIVTVQEGEEYSHYEEGMAFPDLSLYEMVADDLNMELARFDLQTDTLSFSGTDAHEISNFTGTGATLTDMVNSVGKTITRSEVISTSISYGVSNSFGDYILEIYDPAGVTKGMYCSSISQFSDEFELLLAGDTTYEVIGAGVREVTFESFGSAQTEDAGVYEEGMDDDLELEGDDAPPATDSAENEEVTTTTVVKPYYQLLIKKNAH